MRYSQLCAPLFPYPCCVGLSFNGTYLPHAINPFASDDGVLRNDMKTALVEAEMVMCGAVSEVLERTGVDTLSDRIQSSTCRVWGMAARGQGLLLLVCQKQSVPQLSRVCAEDSLVCCC